MTQDTNGSQTNSFEQQDLTLKNETINQENDIETTPKQLVVSTLVDENDGDLSEGDLSLREAILNAQAGSTITFDSSLSDGKIELKLGELELKNSVNITGLGADKLTIDANESSSRVFDIDDGNGEVMIDVAIDGLTITGGNVLIDPSEDETGKGNAGGGIFNAENLNLSNTLVTENTAAISGGGIANTGTLQVANSTISNNDASRFQASGGGGIANTGALNVENSTITGNTSLNSGAIDSFNTPITISNSTITNNIGRITTGGINAAGTITSSIVAGNANNEGDSDRVESNLSGNFTSGGNNIIGNGEDATGFIDGENGDLVGTVDHPIDPQLGDLQNNGGTTPTQALLEGSPAIDAGSNPSNLTTDQRGAGFERTVGSGTDIGAFEVQGGGGNPTELVVSTLEDENDGDFGAGDLSLREAIVLANQNEGGDTISFDSSLAGGIITFDPSQERNLTIDDSVAIAGLGQDNLTLDGGFIFNITQPDAAVAIDGLNIVGGKIDSSGNLTLTNSKLSQTIETGSDNSVIISRGLSEIINSTISDNSGGSNVGILVESGTTSITASAIVNNQADQAQAGIIVGNEATVNILNSTIADNQGRSIAGIENRGRLNLFSSTVAHNNGGLSGGGIVNFAQANIASAIVAQNSGGNNVGDLSGDGEFVSSGNNLIGNGDNAVGFINGENGDLVGNAANPINPKLGDLQNNGGTTPTQALQSDSPAIDAGSNPSNLTADQRGAGFERTVGAGTDIGAFEVQGGGGNPTELVVSTLEDENDGDLSQGDFSLREAILNAQAGSTITFDSELANGEIELQLGELVIDKSLTIQGLGASQTVIDAGGNSRVFNVNDGSTEILLDVKLNDLAITGAGGTFTPDNPVPTRGGGIWNSENLEVNNANIYDNFAVFNGGGIYSDGSLIVNNSAIYDNVTDSSDRTASGGGISNAGTAIINQSTISSNEVGGSIGAGGIENIAGKLFVTNSTVEGNDRGGISNSGGTVEVTSTIVAGNANNNDVFGDDFISGGNNLIGGENLLVGGAVGFINGENGDLVGTAEAPIDPLLGELQDNGGATLTQALQLDSPGIDGGSNPNNLVTDQRGAGFERTVGAGTDIGAFEVQAKPDVSDNAASDNLTGSNQSELILGIENSEELPAGEVFAIGAGENTIFDFQDGIDKLLLAGELESTAVEDLTIFAVDGGTGIGTNSELNNPLATVVGLSPEQITQDDFLSNQTLHQ